MLVSVFFKIDGRIDGTKAFFSIVLYTYLEYKSEIKQTPKVINACMLFRTVNVQTKK